MSFFRPRWLDDLVKPLPSASSRLRGLKAFEPHQVNAFQDVLYADDPIFWSCFGFAAINGVNISYVGVQVPADDSLVAIVDELLIDNGAGAQGYTVDVSAPALGLGTDPNVFKRNRREQNRSAAIVERAGILRVIDNTHVLVGTTIQTMFLSPNTTFRTAIGWRLFAGEQLFIRGVAGVAVEATLFGRLAVKGQR